MGMENDMFGIYSVGVWSEEASEEVSESKIVRERKRN